MTKKKKELINNFLIAAAVVLIWRGIWHLLDMVDIFILGGDQLLTAVGGIIAGILILYIPDKDLKELGKL
jgi:hypothetical protein